MHEILENSMKQPFNEDSARDPIPFLYEQLTVFL